MRKTVAALLMAALSLVGCSDDAEKDKARAAAAQRPSDTEEVIREYIDRINKGDLAGADALICRPYTPDEAQLLGSGTTKKLREMSTLLSVGKFVAGRHGGSVTKISPRAERLRYTVTSAARDTAGNTACISYLERQP